MSLNPTDLYPRQSSELDTLSPLERSFVELAKKHRYSQFAVAYRGEAYGPQYRFEAVAHFDDAAAGQIPCASGDGETIPLAIQSLIDAVWVKRRILPTGADALYGDGELLEGAA